jgi:hypothetical protein
MKGIFFTIDNIIWDRTTYVVYGGYLKEIKKAISQLGGSESLLKELLKYPPEKGWDGGQWFDEKSGEGIIWIEEHKDSLKLERSIVHEVYHAVDSIAESCDFKKGKEYEGAAHTMEFLYAEVKTKIFEYLKIPITKKIS